MIRKYIKERTFLLINRWSKLILCCNVNNIIYHKYDWQLNGMRQEAEYKSKTICYISIWLLSENCWRVWWVGEGINKKKQKITWLWYKGIAGICLWYWNILWSLNWFTQQSTVREVILIIWQKSCGLWCQKAQDFVGFVVY